MRVKSISGTTGIPLGPTPKLLNEFKFTSFGRPSSAGEKILLPLSGLWFFKKLMIEDCSDKMIRCKMANSHPNRGIQLLNNDE